MREDDLTRRAAELAVTTPLPAAEIHRRVRAEYGRPFGYRRCSEAVHRARTRADHRPARRDPSALADRILALLDAELARLEAKGGQIDLDRLDKLSRTLRTVEPIRPKSESKRAPSLASIVPESDQARGDLSDLSESTNGHGI